MHRRLCLISTLISCLVSLTVARADPRAWLRVYNGDRVNGGNQYNYIALIMSFQSKTKFSACTGSLIDSTHVLTAAHCATSRLRNDVPTSRLRVVFNTKNVNQLEAAIDRKDYYKVARIHVHPRFSSGDDSWLSYDVAVLELEEPVTNLPCARLSRHWPVPGTNVDILGLGEDRSTPGHRGGIGYLRRGNMAIETCPSVDIFQQMICTVPNGHVQYSEDGDSGGPLLNPSGQIVGVVSFSISSNVAELDGVSYSPSVPRDYSWIVNTVCQHPLKAHQPTSMCPSMCS